LEEYSVPYTGHSTVLVMIYLSKNLEFYGITGKFGALLESHLNGRYQRVDLGANNSTNSSSSSWA
jgi:hypothetical protein